MANTIPDITVTNSAWSDVYSLAGITVGDSLIITNKSASTVLLIEASTAPLATVVDGVPLKSGMQAIINNAPNGVFAKMLNIQNGPLCVQRGQG